MEIEVCHMHVNLLFFNQSCIHISFKGIFLFD